jgi:hypothetical protein
MLHAWSASGVGRNAASGWTSGMFSTIMAASGQPNGEGEMDCPNCGVYNPDEREICWRCDQELPKPPKPKKKKDPASTMRRMWIIIIVVLAAWLFISWVLPMIMGGGP